MRLARNLYDNLEEYACAALVGVMILCLILQVFMRFVFGSALAWSEELSRFSFLWSVYVGAALAAKRGAHVRITAQFMKLGTRGRLFFRVVCDAIWLGFNIFLVVQSIEVIRDGLDFPETSPTLGIVKAWVEMIIPFGFALMSWRIVERYYTAWRAGTLAGLVNYEEQV
ncbi:TRAP transporter small permease [Desulfocurvus sp.]|jgi:TRAP-type C4-dicarboxylate transport system permease small subunit|uniref:TRAP transporter small permease n=1 Tax=Desulfocurvus sp. TaxID=2871698 RepID=UPI0025C09986|nr:TRAP transporter small permease [Desulfocurvus sp.]MCK9240587.1 TRAP transporter small permease [Desulfocurvus sp.]